MLKLKSWISDNKKDKNTNAHISCIRKHYLYPTNMFAYKFPTLVTTELEPSLLSNKSIHFAQWDFVLMPLGKAWIHLFSPEGRVI